MLTERKRISTGRRLGPLAGFALALALLAVAAPAVAQTGGLTGKATLKDGTPCVKCLILIERQDIKGTYKVNTNKKGEYTYIGLPLGQYKITLHDSNGQVLYYITHHVGLGDPTAVDFDLPKLIQEDQKRQAVANPQAAQQAVQEQKEQKEFVGLKQTFDQGNALYAQGKYPEAAAMFEQAVPLAKDKNLVVVYAKLADTYDRAKLYDKAVDAYNKALALNPNDATLHNGLGNTFAETGKIPEAEAEFQKSATLDPAGASKAYYNLGAIMYNSGKMDAAVDAFKKATQADPKMAAAYFLEGQALMGKATLDPKTQKVVPAPGTVEAYQTYLQLDPSGPYADQAHQLLETLTGKVDTEYKKTKKK